MASTSPIDLMPGPEVRADMLVMPTSPAPPGLALNSGMASVSLTLSSLGCGLARVAARCGKRLCCVPTISSLIALVRSKTSLVDMISSERGRGNGTLWMLATRPGRGLITTTRSARKIASSIEWVMRTMVVRVSSQISSTSRFISSRVKASSAPNGSSISSTDGL